MSATCSRIWPASWTNKAGRPLDAPERINPEPAIWMMNTGRTIQAVLRRGLVCVV